MSQEAPTLFVRRASGLVRTIGPFTAFMIVFSHTVGGGIHKLAVQAAYNSPGAYIPYSFLVTGLLAGLPTAIIYTMLGSMMPRTGGDYIFITRGLSPILGFVASWGFWFTEVLSYGIIAWYSIDFFAGALTISGVVLNNPGLTGFAQWLSTTEGHWIVGSIFVFGFALLALFGMRVYSWVVNILGTLAIIGVLTNLIILGGFGLAAGASVVGWDRVFGAGAYEKIVQKSFELSSQYKGVFPVSEFSWSDTMRAGIGAIWAYIGITSAVYVGGEIKSPSKTLFISQVLGTIVIMLYYIGLPALVYNAWRVPSEVLDKTGASKILEQMNVPKDRVYFIALYQFLMNNWGSKNVAALLGVPEAHLLPAGVVTTYTVTLLPPELAWFQVLNGILVGIVLLKDIPAFFLVSSRMIFAWSFDRFFPEIFSRVNSTFNSPHWAIILTMVGGLLGVVLNILSGEWLASVDTTMLYQFAVMVAGLSAAVLPFIRSDIYEKSSAKYSIFGIPLLSLFGILAFGSNFYFLIVAGTWLNPERDLVMQTFWMALGVAIFTGYLIKNVKRGIDVKTIYTEIPPA
ncbi:MAG: APC family permease [Nitrososphaeria archaeon]